MTHETKAKSPAHAMARHRLQQWDFLHAGTSHMYVLGEQRHVYSVIGWDGSHRGSLHLDGYEADAMKDALAAPIQEPFELRLCERTNTVLQPNRLYRFTVDPKCPHCVAMAHSDDIAAVAKPAAPAVVQDLPKLPNSWRPTGKLDATISYYRSVKADFDASGGNQRGIAAALRDAERRVLTALPDDEDGPFRNSDMVRACVEMIDKLIGERIRG